MDRLDESFRTAKREKRGYLIIYITAGDPDLQTTADLVPALAETGVDAVELGIPFSDPLADGPVIQAAAQRALDNGCTVRGVLDCVRKIREKTDVPLVFMTCYNPILQMGPDTFAREASSAGADGVLVTDLPPAEAREWVDLTREHGLRTVFLVAPSSRPDRVRLAASLTTGFVYCVSRPGVTGERDRVPDELKDLVQRIRETTDKPIAVGFGISKAEHVHQVCTIADAAIVGSAMVKRMAEANGREELLKAATTFARELVAGKDLTP